MNTRKENHILFQYPVSGLHIRQLDKNGIIRGTKNYWIGFIIIFFRSWKRNKECRIILGTILAILIILSILGICFFMMYWGVSLIYKAMQKSKRNVDTELMREIYSLKERVELLERKLDTK